MKNKIIKNLTLLTLSFVTLTNVYAQTDKSCQLNQTKNTLWTESKIVNNNLLSQKNKEDVLIEFFSYACIHCANAEPMIEKIEKLNATQKKPIKIEFIPVIFNKNWEEAAKLYYSLKNLNMLNKDVHKAIFNAYNVDKKQIFSNKDELTKFLEKHYPSKSKQIIDNMNSFSVKNQLTKSNELMNLYQITSTPTVVVDRYNKTQATIGPALTKGVLNMEPVLNQFVLKDCRDSIK